MVTISANGIEEIRKEEGERLKAYKDVAGYWTTGVGHLIKPGEEYLITKTLTPEESRQLLVNDLAKVIQALNKRLTVPVTQNMVDALAGFLFNAGTAAGEGLFKLINANAPKESIYDWWTTHYVTAGGNYIEALKKRRIREASSALSMTSKGVSSNVNNYLIAGAVLVAMSVLLNKKNR